jgi:hypothetical protein
MSVNSRFLEKLEEWNQTSSNHPIQANALRTWAIISLEEQEELELLTYNTFIEKSGLAGVEIGTASEEEEYLDSLNST